MSSHLQSKQRLRSGYTTGACAAAAAKGAVLFFFTGKVPKNVEIPFPDSSRHSFVFCYNALNKNGATTIGLKKDAGDDPDVTNKALITATAQWTTATAHQESCIDLGTFVLCGGQGVGMVTKPGLAIDPGEPAINPVPRTMIAEAVAEALHDHHGQIPHDQRLLITIAVPEGEFLSTKTLNHRLGIVGGISILGTTGIVRPISAEAWQATISASMHVARAAGLDNIVLSTGRTSEKGAQKVLNLAIEAYAMMGDFFEFSLREAALNNFTTIHYAGMWAKVMKAALHIPQTHVRNGALEVEQAAQLLIELGAPVALGEKLMSCNTAREMLFYLNHEKRSDLIRAVCQRAKKYAESISQRTVHIYLVDDKAEVIYYE